jgi:hypothetical protein
MNRKGTTVEVNGNRVSVYRERPATAAERRSDPGAELMCEWVHITFRQGEPEVVINRDLSEG